MHAIKSVVTVSFCLVGLLAANVAGAETKTYSGATKGNWSVDENWTPAGVPTADDEVTISGKAVTVSEAVEIAALTLGKGATLTVKASGTSGALADLYDAALKFKVTGALVMEDGSTLAPTCDPATGTPVRFLCGSFSLAKGAAVDASGKGYNFVAYEGTAPEGSTVRGSFYTFAPGVNENTHTKAASHGGAASVGSKVIYGYPYAPHFAGSCATWNNAAREQDRSHCGGGVVWIEASGKMTIAGLVKATPQIQTDNYCPAAGGSIWLSADTFEADVACGLTACGIFATSGGCGSGGGRISIAIGVSAADLETLARNGKPAGLTYVDSIDAIRAFVGGGWAGGYPNGVTAGAGTATLVTAGGKSIAVVGTPDVPPVYSFPTGTGETKSFTGAVSSDWREDGNWSPEGMPGETDSVVINSQNVTLTGPVKVKSVALDGTAVLTVMATGAVVQTDIEIYRAATVFSVADALTLAGTAKIVPVNDPVSGAPVKFQVGSVAVGENASFNASGKGFSWIEWDMLGYPANRVTYVSDYKTTIRWTGAGSAGSSHDVGVGYGGAAYTKSGQYGRAYGLANAPYLPGSCDSSYTWPGGRGGGTILIEAKGVAALEGKLISDGTRPNSSYTCATGGGIWVIAESLLVGASASISAKAVSSNWHTQSAGGGRVCIVTGVLDAHVEQLLAGESPDDLTYLDELECPCDVSGAFDGKGFCGAAGSVVRIKGEFSGTQVTVGCNLPVAVAGIEPLGLMSLTKGKSQTFSAPSVGMPDGVQNTRYHCLGYVVSNETAEVAQGTENSFEYTIGSDAIAVTWIFGNADKRVDVKVPEHCTVSVGGEAQTEDFQAWHNCGETLTLTVTPTDGYEFVCWSGSVPSASVFSNPFVTDDVQVRKVEPIVRPAGSSQSRTYLGGDWNEPTSWDPEGVPGDADRLTLDGQTLTLTQGVSVVSLMLRNGASLVVQASASSGAVGDLVDAALTVKVYGAMTVGAGCTVRPLCDVATGTPVYFDCGSFVLEEGAHFNASSAGYGWVKGTAPEGATSVNKTNGDKADQGTYYTFAPGAALTFSNVATYDYVLRLAPCLPASPMHLYTTPVGRGGGVAKIKAGSLTVRGIVSANGDGADWSSSSGGAIWLVGESVTFGPAAALCAQSGNCNNNGSTAVGGVVSVCVGLTDEMLETLLAGLTPVGVTVAETLPGVDVRINGGYVRASDAARYRGPAGTLSVVTAGGAAPTVEPKLPARPVVGVLGSGSVTAENGDEATVLTATADAGATFVGWYGDFTGRRVFKAELTVPTDRERRIWAVFMSAGVAKAFAGTNGDDWSDPENWSPVGVPGPGDDVTIEAGTVVATNMIAVKSLTMAGGTLTLTDAPTVVMGDCALSGAAKLSVRAMESDKAAWPELFADAMPFEVKGRMTLADTACVCPCDARVSGAAVCFFVDSLDVGASAQFDATYGGCDFHLVSDPRGEDPRFRFLQMRGVNWYYSLVGGTGTSHQYAPGYGGEANKRTGTTYGYPYAPYLSGGHGGVTYNWPSVCGGGVVLIRAAGKVDLKGTLRSNGNAKNVSYVGSTGGSVWVIAKGFTASSTALLEAKADAVHYDIFGPGGGRVSVATGLSDEEVEALVRGEVPPDVTTGELTSVAYNVDPSYGTVVSGDKTVNMGKPGTATSVTGAHGDTPVLVTGSPVSGIVGVEPSGALSFEQGSVQRFTAPDYGVLEADSQTRFRCAGYVVSNQTECVAHGDGCAFDLEIGPDPLTVIWQWTDEQKGIAVAVPDGCVVSAGGEMHAEDFTCWHLTTGSVSLQVMPGSGYEFLYWIGSYPYGQAQSNPLTIDRAAVRSVRPVVRLAEPRATRTYQGGDWWSPESWMPANVPGLDDDVVIVNKTVGELNTVIVGSLSLGLKGELDLTGTPDWEALTLRTARDLAVTNNSRIVVGKQRQRAHAVVDVGGDFVISGQERDSVAKVRIYGGVMTDTFSRETGCGSVNVGGTMSVGAGCRVLPISEAYTGGSLVFTVGKLEIAAGGSVDATGCGFRQVTSESPSSIAPGVGTGFQYGAGYGGRGGFDSSVSHDGTNLLGQVYGSAYAPIDAGSCSGEHGGNNGVGGGLIRIHAGRIDVLGKLLADGTSGFGSGSGGGIWLTARSYKFRPGAVLSACGANNYGGGGGGRIAIWRKADADLIARLAAGEQPTSDYLQPRDIEAFNIAFPGVTVKVLGGQQGKTSVGEPGTFGWFPVQQGLLLQVK